MSNSNLSVVKETPYGIYVWLMPGGKIVQDDEKNIMSISAREHDLRAITAISNVARSYGLEAGKPHFIPGIRKVTDEEHEQQQARMEQGLIPDPLDIGAWRDEEKFRGAK